MEATEGGQRGEEAVSDDADEPRIRTLHSKRKGCACGGHSANDHKKSKQHHGTRVRIARRKARKKP